MWGALSVFSHFLCFLYKTFRYDTLHVLSLWKFRSEFKRQREMINIVCCEKLSSADVSLIQNRNRWCFSGHQQHFSQVILTGLSICRVFLSHQALAFFFPIRRAICGAHTEGQKLSSAYRLLGVTQHSHISIILHEHTGTHMFMYAHRHTGWHWFWSKHAVMCQRDSERAHNLPTFWLLAQIRTIKNWPWDNEPGWHTCSWRSNSKDVSQPPSLPHLIMSSEWLRLLIIDRRQGRADGGGGDFRDRAYSTDTTAVLEGQEGAYENIVGGCFILCRSSLMHVAWNW